MVKYNAHIYDTHIVVLHTETHASHITYDIIYVIAILRMYFRLWWAPLGATLLFSKYFLCKRGSRFYYVHSWTTMRFAHCVPFVRASVCVLHLFCGGRCVWIGACGTVCCVHGRTQAQAHARAPPAGAKI